jgi:heme-degrading monooxygenase HmoA
MALTSPRTQLLVLLKCNDPDAYLTIPRALSSLGHTDMYEAITSGYDTSWTSFATHNDHGWTHAYVTIVKDEETLKAIDCNAIAESVKAGHNVENIFVEQLSVSKQAVLDTPLDSPKDAFFIIGFALSKDRYDDFAQAWYEAIPYMSSCSGYKRATIYKTLGEKAAFPFYNLAVWATVKEWTDSLPTKGYKESHIHQGHIHRTVFITKKVMTSWA